MPVPTHLREVSIVNVPGRRSPDARRGEPSLHLHLSDSLLLTVKSPFPADEMHMQRMLSIQ